MFFAPTLLMTAVIAAFMTITWPAARKPAALAAYWGAAMIALGGWATMRHLGGAAPFARIVAIAWLACLLSATMLLVPFALLTLAAVRLKFQRLSTYLPYAYAASCAGCGLVLTVTSTADFVVRREDIPIHGLPAALDGYRIANLGDVHVGTFIDWQELARGVQAINEEHVDLVAVTGDLIDDLRQLDQTMSALDTSKAPNMVAILGNHEEMWNVAKVLSAYRDHKAHIKLLLNERIAISHGGAILNVVGVSYPMNHKASHVQPDPHQYEIMSTEADAAFAGLGPDDTILALSHHPAFFPIAAAHGAQLTLASHTHGGQLRLFGHPLINVHTYLQGIYKQGNAYLDVSAGFGHWLPIRFGVPREIVIVTLKAA